MPQSFDLYNGRPSRPLFALVQSACHLKARRIEYRTCKEGGESVYIVEIPRLPGVSAFDALIQLMSIELHWLEEWDCAQTTEDSAEDIVNHWILPALASRQFRESPIEDVRRKIDASVSEAMTFLSSSSRPPEAGVFVDGVRLKESLEALLIEDEIKTGVLLINEWNDVDVFYATEQRFGRLTWGTGA